MDRATRETRITRLPGKPFTQPLFQGSYSGNVAARHPIRRSGLDGVSGTSTLYAFRKTLPPINFLSPRVCLLSSQGGPCEPKKIMIGGEFGNEARLTGHRAARPDRRRSTCTSASTAFRFHDLLVPRSALASAFFETSAFASAVSSSRSDEERKLEPPEVCSQDRPRIRQKVSRWKPEVDRREAVCTTGKRRIVSPLAPDRRYSRQSICTLRAATGLLFCRRPLAKGLSALLSQRCCHIPSGNRNGTGMSPRLIRQSTTRPCEVSGANCTPKALKFLVCQSPTAIARPAGCHQTTSGGPPGRFGRPVSQR